MASYSAFHASCSADETETEEDDNDDDGSGVVGALVLAPAAGAGTAGSNGPDGVAAAAGWKGETRGMSGGTEKGSERAAFDGKVGAKEGEEF